MGELTEHLPQLYLAPARGLTHSPIPNLSPRTTPSSTAVAIDSAMRLESVWRVIIFPSQRDPAE